MRNLSLALLAGLLLVAGGCRKRVPVEPPVLEFAGDTSLVDIAILLRNVPMRRATKATIDIETHIANLNLFFVHQSYPSPASPEVRHYYFEETTIGGGVESQLKLSNIRVGKYRMYAVANYYNGSMAAGGVPPSHGNSPGYGAVDLSSVTEADLKDFQLYNKADHLLMTAYNGEVQIKKPGLDGQGNVISQDQIDINLVRQHAKINFTANINAGNAALSGMTIDGLSFGNWASRIKSFAAIQEGSSGNFVARPGASAGVMQISTDKKQVMLSNCYPLANRQGTNLSITSESSRSSQNAPTGASYLQVATTTETSRYNYSVYLGANQTSDFNLAANSNYTVQMNIAGLSDPRISSVAITQPHFTDPGAGGLTTTGEFTISISNRFNEQFKLNTTIMPANPPFGTYQFFLYDEGLGDFSTTPLPTEVDGSVIILDTSTPGLDAQMTIRCKVIFTASSLPTFQEAKLSIGLLTNNGQIVVVDDEGVQFREN